MRILARVLVGLLTLPFRLVGLVLKVSLLLATVIGLAVLAGGAYAVYQVAAVAPF